MIAMHIRDDTELVLANPEPHVRCKRTDRPSMILFESGTAATRRQTLLFHH